MPSHQFPFYKHDTIVNEKCIITHLGMQYTKYHFFVIVLQKEYKITKFYPLGTEVYNNCFPCLGIICYDDACHLKKFAHNPVHSTQTAVASRIAEMEILCDRFHFKNHIDVWCHQHCNPHTSENLQVQNYV